MARIRNAKSGEDAPLAPNELSDGPPGERALSRVRMMPYDSFVKEQRGPRKMFVLPARLDRALSLTTWSSLSSLLLLCLFETIHVAILEGFVTAYQNLFRTVFLFLGVLGWAFLLGSLPVSWLLADMKGKNPSPRRLASLTAFAGWSAAALSFALYNTVMGLLGVHTPILLDAHYSLMLLTAGIGSGIGYFFRAVRMSNPRRRKRKVRIRPVVSRNA